MTVVDIREMVETGEAVESRPDDLPYLSRLVPSSVRGRSPHAVIAENQAEDMTIAVTVSNTLLAVPITAINDEELVEHRQMMRGE